MVILTQIFKFMHKYFDEGRVDAVVIDGYDQNHDCVPSFRTFSKEHQAAASTLTALKKKKHNFKRFDFTRLVSNRKCSLQTGELER